MRSSSVDVAKAFAIGSVFLYHLSPELFKSGFIGVDVFLVVTGYLSAMRLSKVNGYRFIKDRLVRIYPALSVLLVLGFLGVLTLGYFTEVYGYLKYSISSSFLLTNFHLYLDNGYFSQDLYSNVLFHLWSISLEFQSWIILAFLAYWASFLRLIYSVGLISFILAAYVLYIEDVNSFYLLTPFRLWEVVLGVWAFNIKKRLGGQYSSSLVFIVLCIWSLLVFVDMKEYWYLWPITPILASIMLVSDLRLGTVWRIIPLYLSRRTYSLYLWHVPIICIFQYYLSMVGWSSVLIIFAATFLISELSYRYIEK